MTKAEIDGFFRTLSERMPEPETELVYSNPFTLLVAVVLSAQATDVGVNKATKALFEIADNAADMAALGEETIREHVKTIGLFNTKAKNVLKLSQMLVANHGGRVPHDRDALRMGERVKPSGPSRQGADDAERKAPGQPRTRVEHRRAV